MGNDRVHEEETELKANTSLDSYYMSTFQYSFRETTEGGDDVIRSVLSTVILAAYPLPPSAIATLTDLQYARVQGVLQSVQMLLARPDDPDGPAQFLDETFSDFVTDPTRCTDMRFYIPPDYHAELLLHCLNLMAKSLKKNMFSIPKYALNSELEDLPQRIEESGIRGALEYACRSWHKHLAATMGQTARISPILRRFLEQKFLFWLEVLSCLDAVDDATRALKTTIEWLSQVGPDRWLGCPGILVLIRG